MEDDRIVYSCEVYLAGVFYFLSRFSSGRGFLAGGKHPIKSSPPTTAASPEFGRPPRLLLRLAFSPRS